MESEKTINVPRRISHYQIRGAVGEGAFSIVRLAFCLETKEYFACKIVPRRRIINELLQQRFEQEIRIIQQLRHPGIVQLYDLIKDEENYYLIMEFCPNGELFHHIVERHHLPEKDAKANFHQILEALQYVHAQGIAHRDLKPENILIDTYGHLKISDFGLSRYVGLSGLAETPCGSPCYAAPEVLSGNPYDGKKCDIWSVGVILFAMVTGQLPWTKKNQTQLFEQIKAGDYNIPEYLTDDCKDLIKKLMTVDVNERITLEDALVHPWFSNLVPRFGVPAERSMRCSVSLRTVDRFFDRDQSEKNICDEPNMPRSTSCSARSIEEVLKSIKGRTGFRSSGPIRNAGVSITSPKRK